MMLQNERLEKFGSEIEGNKTESIKNNENNKINDSVSSGWVWFFIRMLW